MTTFAENQARIARSPTCVVRLIMDTCANTFSVGACAADGVPCYYTYPTCKDPDNYSKTTRNYDFCLNRGWRIPGLMPLIAALQQWTTSIKPDQAITRAGTLRISMLDDSPLPWANPDKPTNYQNRETGGSWWRNFLARNPNYADRPAEIWQGFSNLVWPIGYRRTFRGLISALELGEAGCDIELIDFLKKLEAKVPTRESSTNKLTANYLSGATMSVADVTEFPESGTVRIQDDRASTYEYVSYTGRNLDGKYLTGCVAGRYGTSKGTRAVGCPVRSMACFADPATGEGIPADRAFLDLLVTCGGISALDIGTRDQAITLSSACDADDATLNINGQVFSLPGSGIVRIGDELVIFQDRSGGANFTIFSSVGPSELSAPLSLTNRNYWWFRINANPGAEAIDRLSFWLSRAAGVTGYLYISLFEDTSGHPGSILDQTFGTIYVNTLSDEMGQYYIYKHHALTPGAYYWIRIATSALTGNVYIEYVNTGAPQGQFACSSTPNYQAGTWTWCNGSCEFIAERIDTTPPKLLNCLRGQYGTTAAGHPAGSEVLITDFSDEVRTWLAPCLYRRFVGSPTPVHELVTELRQATLGRIWQGEDSKIHFKAAPRPLVLPGVKLIEDKDIINRSLQLEQNEGARLTRITTHYNSLNPEDPGTAAEEYQEHYLRIEAFLEDPNYFGSIKDGEFFLPWIYQGLEARAAADALLMRFRYGAPILNLQVELKDAADIFVGDFLQIATDLVIDEQAVTRLILYEITSKRQVRIGSNEWDLTVLAFASGMGGGGMTGRGCVISPLSYNNSYDFYGDEDHSIFGWVCDENFQVGAAKDPGYSIT